MQGRVRLNQYRVPLRGKLRQIARAVQLELRLSKEEILTLYLNHTDGWHR